MPISPDLVVRAHADPVRDRPVLLHLLAKGHLGAEGLVGRLAKKKAGFAVVGGRTAGGG